MTQIESIIALMRNDLNTRQLSKLQTVLETILKARHAPPPLSDLIRRFESSKRIMGIKDTTMQILKEDPTYFDRIIKNAFK